MDYFIYQFYINTASNKPKKCRTFYYDAIDFKIWKPIPLSILKAIYLSLNLC
jgi:hypothetical protein